MTICVVTQGRYSDYNIEFLLGDVPQEELLRRCVAQAQADKKRYWQAYKEAQSLFAERTGLDKEMAYGEFMRRFGESPECEENRKDQMRSVADFLKEAGCTVLEYTELNLDNFEGD